MSGFLITLIMLREESRSGRVDLRAFFTRRLLRIVPAYAAFLAFVAALAWAGLAETRPLSWVTALTYTTNFLPRSGAGWALGHTWSLSVEEHFYLVWPPAFVILGRRWAWYLLAAACVSGPLIRYFLWSTMRDRINLGFVTPARIDSIAFGCLLAYLATSSHGVRWSEFAARWWATFVLLAGTIALASKLIFCRSTLYEATLDRSIVAIAVSMGVFACISSPHTPLGDLLEARSMATIGRLSYSLYLWQQPFFDPHLRTWMCRWPQNLGLAVACAVSCHFLIERPFLQLKGRIGRRRHDN
jgi:peptidoglycan/LPS O-acetylase OafA/YrhL